MTCAELVDTLLERKAELAIITHPKSPRIEIQYSRMIGNQRWAATTFIGKEYLDEFEDQQYKEGLIERAIEELLEERRR